MKPLRGGVAPTPPVPNSCENRCIYRYTEDIPETLKVWLQVCDARNINLDNHTQRVAGRNLLNLTDWKTSGRADGNRYTDWLSRTGHVRNFQIRNIHRYIGYWSDLDSTCHCHKVVDIAPLVALFL